MSRLLRSVLTVAAGAAVAGLTGSAMLRRSRRLDLPGKTALVTGGSRGLGLAIATELARRGVRLAICARDEAELRAAQEQLSGYGVELLTSVCDVTRPDDIARFVAQTFERFGVIDILVNNAGVVSVGPVATMQLEDFRSAMDVHFEAPLRFILQVLPAMRRRRAGRIVNITSFGGKVPAPHLAPYAASKFAAVGLSETLRAELLQDGIYVTTVCPGLIRTGSPSKGLFKGDPKAEYQWFATSDNTPIVSIDPQRLARQVVDAMEHGDAELISPFVARWQVKLYQLFPSLGQEAAALVNRLLPRDESRRSARGVAVGPAALPNYARKSQENAEQKHNQAITPDPEASGE
jgi:short-subunit dehydrogenase